ncbi:50S ribosomal protein L4 [Rhodospirillum rubrum]|uniref:Large ribosomal subunit protein uL4 n=1 Tax=Rhodospirillum rubrum (strain ATCC 11170 / ATH 1.1.1 / DSM 467 / LMG 4362 / NCIMB 8255 / S1) TaxID=269796 RepID=RL4_RHORT|nr:50S ribosomal protein L4 [Rhodospirillum rubrum]Q2RQW1.1 RecName: Full=Large ribosomal subunit protein uL4; AltName: Full=50S ribosomal protein L4 [Rhodospirillum rubrum ATCC 11170]ABC23484.1 LSU ribosomal protein L4P [Rhodospirillum rubrum ATCC 11170]AEO49222.1 50S ribosomal protein L4 [Rhodospirillum rubrum F11]MBK1665100.1 50S ribosomal protein L4 [Rhodospirillum rubrum]MBK1677488.1 50S ribosomal protein L4 [Rhodospirillum rubrum]MBK5955154.1 50S ribosomal protein L4 [Rhodospirillum rub
MKCDVKTLDGKDAGSIELSDSVFGLPVRTDLLHRMVRWQLARRQAGTHKTKGISEISGTTAKPFKQKGTGHARQGSKRSPQFRGGATIFGPVVRSHAHDLNKKVRKLGLKTALSAKAQAGQLIVLDQAISESGKTKDLLAQLKVLGLEKVLFIDGPEVNEKFALAARNIIGLDVLPQQGANVYDILRRDTLVLTKEAVKHLEERLQ